MTFEVSDSWQSCRYIESENIVSGQQHKLAQNEFTCVTSSTWVFKKSGAVSRAETPCLLFWAQGSFFGPREPLSSLLQCRSGWPLFVQWGLFCVWLLSPFHFSGRFLHVVLCSSGSYIAKNFPICL